MLCIVTPHRQVLRAPGANQRRAVLVVERAGEPGVLRFPCDAIAEDEGLEPAAIRAASLGQSARVLRMLGEVILAPAAARTVAVQIEAPRAASLAWSTHGREGAIASYRFALVDDSLSLAADLDPVRPLLAKLDWTYWHRGGRPRAVQHRRGDR